jgi:hypothetical protein
MNEISPSTGSQKLASVSQLVEAGNIDTVYRDLYIERAQVILAAFLPQAEYFRLRCSKLDIDDLLRQAASALERRDWLKVKGLSGRIRVLTEIVEKNRTLSELAGKIYEPIGVPLNEFDPGLRAILGLARQDPANLRDTVVQNLTTLEKGDANWREFYARRRAYFQSLNLSFLRVDELDDTNQMIDPARIQKQARSALDHRDINSLERLAEKMLRPQPSIRVDPMADVEPLNIREVQSFTFSDKTLAAARRFQLVAVPVESSYQFGDYLRCCCALHAKIPDRPLTEAGKSMEGCTCGHSCPPYMPEPIKSTLDLLMLHPFINSAGVRYLPGFVPEVVLVEDFPEDEKSAPVSELLIALGLPRRSALSRMEIDQALLQRGAQIVRNELYLDPQEFRLACIPFDLYSRLAETRGWGQKKLWTHFDGFQIWKPVKLRALVGGDVQFGGKYDLCSISRADENDRVIARFSVLRRERFQAV